MSDEISKEVVNLYDRDLSGFKLKRHFQIFDNNGAATEYVYEDPNVARVLADKMDKERREADPDDYLVSDKSYFVREVSVLKNGDAVFLVNGFPAIQIPDFVAQNKKAYEEAKAYSLSMLTHAQRSLLNL